MFYPLNYEEVRVLLPYSISESSLSHEIVPAIPVKIAIGSIYSKDLKNRNQAIQLIVSNTLCVLISYYHILG